MLDLQSFFRFRDRERKALACEQEPLLLTDFVDDEDAGPAPRRAVDAELVAARTEG